MAGGQLLMGGGRGGRGGGHQAKLGGRGGLGGEQVTWQEVREAPGGGKLS